MEEATLRKLMTKQNIGSDMAPLSSSVVIAGK
jgi:hypothetical protein